MEDFFDQLQVRLPESSLSLRYVAMLPSVKRIRYNQASDLGSVDTEQLQKQASQTGNQPTNQLCKAK